VIDREKVLAVLRKRFPDAASHDLAAAANAIVGLDPEYLPLVPPELARFECDAGRQFYTMRHVATGELRLYRRMPGASSITAR
jgi:hypothetical protein